MTYIIVKIMAELLSVLALATKQIKQGRFSKHAFLHIPAPGSMRYREIRKEIARRERGRVCSAEVGQADPGRGSDDCRTDSRSCPWTCEQYEGGHGRCAILGLISRRHFAHRLSH
jgi:hypothetical protein